MSLVVFFCTITFRWHVSLSRPGDETSYQLIAERFRSKSFVVRGFPVRVHKRMRQSEVTEPRECRWIQRAELPSFSVSRTVTCRHLKRYSEVQRAKCKCEWSETSS